MLNKTKRPLYKIDAAGQAVGRLASKIAVLLRGKNRVDFEPRLDQGGIVEVNNIRQLKFSGKKFEQKKYFHYSGYPGGMKVKKMSEIFAKNPGEILKRAVKKMIPANKQRERIMKRLIIKS